MIYVADYYCYSDIASGFLAGNIVSISVPNQTECPHTKGFSESLVELRRIKDSRFRIPSARHPSEFRGDSSRNRQTLRESPRPACPDSGDSWKLPLRNALRLPLTSAAETSFSPSSWVNLGEWGVGHEPIYLILFKLCHNVTSGHGNVHRYDRL